MLIQNFIPYVRNTKVTENRTCIFLPVSTKNEKYKQGTKRGTSEWHEKGDSTST